MSGKRKKPEDIVLKLRQVEVLHGQGKPLSDAVRQIGVTVQTYYRLAQRICWHELIQIHNKCLFNVLSVLHYHLHEQPSA